MLEMQTLVVSLNLAGPTMEGRVHEKKVLWRIAELRFYEMFRVAFLCQVRYGAVRRLSYKPMMMECEGVGRLLRVLSAMVDAWFEPSLRHHKCNKEIDPVLALSSDARVAELTCVAFPDQGRFPYDYAQKR